jgi:CRISPR-associated endonuclease/helicase Cas3
MVTPRWWSNRWFSGKKSILDEFSIGTIDNLLQMDLKQKHLALKHLGLSNKVVIIDEVHAYDSFMDQHLFRTLEWLGTYHVPIVVLSATLPKATRNRLLEAYFHGKFGQKLSKGADLSGVSSDWQDSEAYPLVSMLDGRRLNQVSHFDGKTNQSQLSIHVERMSGDLTALGERVLDAIADGGVAGVIVNTIKRAQALADALAGKVPFIVLHSAFVAAQRAQLETELPKCDRQGEQAPRQAGRDRHAGARAVPGYRF